MTNTLHSSDSHAIDPNGRRVHAVAELQIAGRLQFAEYVLEIAGNRQFADGVGDLAVLDPEAGSAAAVIAGDAVDAHAHKFGDVKPFADIGHQFGRAARSRRHVEI